MFATVSLFIAPGTPQTTTTITITTSTTTTTTTTTTTITITTSTTTTTTTIYLFSSGNVCRRVSLDRARNGVFPFRRVGGVVHVQVQVLRLDRLQLLPEVKKNL
jgi:hypothetical protein